MADAGTVPVLPAGLTAAEAAARLAHEGPNELPAARPRGLRDVVRDVVREPMFMLLGAAAGIYLLIGDVHEAMVLLASVFVVMAITIYQERKSERALEALRDLSSPRALVMRDGAALRIAGRELVRGDVLIVKEGDRVPADAVMLEGQRPARRRIAADRRIGAGAQDRMGRPHAARPRRRRRPAVHLLGHAAGAGPGRGRGIGNRCGHRTGQDRPRAGGRRTPRRRRCSGKPQWWCGGSRCWPSRCACWSC